MNDRDRYWFPAKTYGWGWGPPQTWEGWLVTLLYFALLGLAGALLLPQGRTFTFVFTTFCLSLGLVWVCWIKGEPPRWRWGK